MKTNHSCWITRNVIISSMFSLAVMLVLALWGLLAFAQGMVAPIESSIKSNELRIRANEIKLAEIKSQSNDIKWIREFLEGKKE